MFKNILFSNYLAIFTVMILQANLLYAEAIDKIFDSVVFVSSSKINPKDISRPLPHKGMGPGILIDTKGHVLVQDSILSDLHSIECAINGLGYWPAILIGKDKLTKVALLEIKAPEKVLKKLRPVKVYDSTVVRYRYGQEIKIVGVSPDGNFIFYKSRISRPFCQIEFGTSILDRVVQIDTFVHKGLNGAPVFDKKNRLIGMALEINEKLAPNIGFFLPIKEVLWVAKNILENGRVIRAYLGAKVVSVDSNLKRLLDLPTDKGVLIVDVDKNSPASKAGLKGCKKSLRLGNRIYPMGGDLIVAIDRVPVKNDLDLIELLNKKGPGKKILISFYRDGRLKRKEVILEGR